MLQVQVAERGWSKGRQVRALLFGHQEGNGNGVRSSEYSVWISAEFWHLSQDVASHRSLKDELERGTGWDADIWGLKGLWKLRRGMCDCE